MIQARVAWAAVKAFFSGWKLYALVAVWCITAAFFYFQGKEACQEGALKALDKELTRTQQKAAKAVARAAEGTKRLEENKAEAKESEDEAEQVTSDDACPVDDDQLRVLREIKARSAD